MGLFKRRKAGIGVTFTANELKMMWCLAIDNMKYWEKVTLQTFDENDLMMYRIARSTFSKLQHNMDNSIFRKIKGTSHKKYILKRLNQLKGGE